MAGKSKYYEIKEQVEAMILRGEYPLGSKLPSEPELAEIFNASRGTIRRTLSVLADEGIVARRSGVGTLVVRLPRVKSVQIRSLSEELKAKGMVPRTRVLVKEKIRASEAGGRVCEAFFLHPEEAAKTDVFRVKRLRYGDNQPLVLQTVCLLAEDFKPDLLEKQDFTQSVFNLYALYHRQVAWADEIIQARPASPEEIDLLEMHGLPPHQRFVYVRDRISYDQENLPLEVLISVDRGDFFQAYRYRVVEDELHLEMKNEDE